MFRNLLGNSPSITIDKSASLQQAISLMVHHRIHHLIVTEKNFPIGILTDRDIFYRCYPLTGKGTSPFVALTIEEITRRRVPVIDSKTTLSKTLEEMEALGVSAVLSHNADGTWGILTETDLLKLLNDIAHKSSWRKELLSEAETALASPVLQKLIESVNQMGI